MKFRQAFALSVCLTAGSGWASVLGVAAARGDMSYVVLAIAAIGLLPIIFWGLTHD